MSIQKTSHDPPALGQPYQISRIEGQSEVIHGGRQRLEGGVGGAATELLVRGLLLTNHFAGVGLQPAAGKSVNSWHDKYYQDIGPTPFSYTLKFL